MSAFSDQVLGSTMRFEMTTNNERTARAVRVDQAGDTLTASSKSDRQENRPWQSMPAFPWLDARFDRPCAIPSPLNDI